ncbi:MAG: hypothetical protein M1838_005035 [Thelocarpon superellum]|nr:MAG: hypothetical protein M1838_005035 [Thelocarpon superellum]
MRMPGWYDITDFSDLAQKSADEEGILRSREYIRSLIRAETVEKKIPSSRVIVGGFSQGAAVAVLTGLTSKEPLGGVFGLSGYLLLGEKVPSLVPEGVDKKALKIFMGHGEDDPLVKFEWGRMSAAKLREWGWDVEFKSYKDLGHSVDLKEMDDLEAWLKARLA